MFSRKERKGRKENASCINAIVSTSFGPSIPTSVQSPLQAKCNLIRGKLRRARSNAPQRFEASSWASCRTTADASSFCESRAVRHICRTSSTQMSRSRVTFVILPAKPWPVPSKNRQRFIPSIHHSRPSNFETGIITSKYPSAAATGDRCP